MRQVIYPRPSPWLRVAKFFLIGLCFSCGASEERSRAALEKSGYKDIEITGYSPFSCDEKDSFSTGFKATNPVGQRVEGVVCCGLLKNCTVRF